MKHFIAPSILSADFANLNQVIEMLNQSEADWIHLDIMDGRFVPNITFGFLVINTIKKVSKKPLDVHLMIVEPDKYIQQFVDVGADIISVHYETCDHLHRTVHSIKEKGIKVGVALNPHNPVSLLEDILPEIDIVNLMTVNPGFGGQKFIKNSLIKIQQLKQMIISKNLKVNIEIDGGVKVSNAAEILRAGADILVAGSDVFQNSSPSEVIRTLKKIDTHTLNV